MKPTEDDIDKAARYIAKKLNMTLDRIQRASIMAAYSKGYRKGYEEGKKAGARELLAR